MTEIPVGIEASSGGETEGYDDVEYVENQMCSLCDIQLSSGRTERT